MKSSTPRPVVLVDGSSYLYRAFHALPPLTNSRGQPTGAIKGVTSMLKKLSAEYPGSVVAVIFDAKGKTFRDELFAEYKAHRPSMPEELRAQVEPIHQIVKAMGYPLIVVEGVEADDVIGTFAQQATEAGQDLVVSTGDKDLAQLVNAHVTLVNTMTDTLLDEEGVRDKFGVGPELIVDFLALMGDKSDNIPGVAGVGEKSALALLQGLGNLDSIYANLDKVAELDFRGAKKMAAKLRAEEAQARLSRKLAAIKRDVPMELDVSSLSMDQPDSKQLLTIFRELEFRAWTEELEQQLSADGHATEAPAEAAEYELILDEAALQRWLQRLEQAELFAFDTETNSLNYMEARVVGVSFATAAGQAAYLPFGHDYDGAPKQLSETQVFSALKPLLESEDSLKVGQNLKYDHHVLTNHDIELRGIAFDTMLESYVLDSTATRHDMDSLALKYLDRKTIHFEDVAGKGAKQRTFNQVELEQAGPYAAEDADVTLQLHQTLFPRLQENPRQCAVLTDIEVPLIRVLSRMESHGALVDAALLAKQSKQLAKRIAELESEAHELAGESFNVASTKQLQEIMFNKLGLPVIKKTPKGQPSTAEPVLQELALDYELPRVLLEYRGLSKLKSTYTDALPEQINARTGRIHTSYHQAVAATGRLSSTEPNLQNIPIRSEEGRRVRQAFIAPPGCSLLAADYSQIELRIMAHLSGDQGLLRAFAEGLDVHRATAAEVFNVPLDQVSAEQRRSAKAINFGLIYGMSAFGLGNQLHVGRNEAQSYIDRYFERYPGVKDYMERTRALAAKQGFVETLFGRRLYLPEINARNFARRQAAERTAINAPMQGSAADIIKRAMLAVDRWLQASTLQSRMIMQVHDELVCEVPEDELDELKSRITSLMESAASLDVPLVVDVGVGANWDEAH